MSETWLSVGSAQSAVRVALKSISVWHGVAELVSQAAKFLCDLDAYLEVSETRHYDARRALVIVSGLPRMFPKSSI